MAVTAARCISRPTRTSIPWWTIAIPAASMRRTGRRAAAPIALAPKARPYPTGAGRYHGHRCSDPGNHGDLTKAGQRLLVAQWLARARQYAFQVQHQPRAAADNARQAGRCARPQAGAEGAGRRRSARIAECRQEYLHSLGVGGQAEVADYPFTTLVPNLGVVSGSLQEPRDRRYPGLIEGASRCRARHSLPPSGAYPSAAASGRYGAAGRQ